MPVAAESCIRTTADARRLHELDAADVIVIKPQRIGGVREALRAADAAECPRSPRAHSRRRWGSPPSWPLRLSLPDAPFAHGAGTALLLASDVVARSAHPGRWLAGSPPTGCRPATARRGMTEPTEGDVALSYVTALLDALVDGGVTHMCMTPGSRSTPIALAAARHPDITLHVHVDERSSAFFGLGIAAATGQPVAMFCTSGTAAANHLPAVVEASLARCRSSS